MNTAIAIAVFASFAGLGFSASAQTPRAPLQDQLTTVSISPISMTANSAGLEITSKILDRWSSQTELTVEQLASLGLVPGKLDEGRYKQVLGSDLERRARNFGEFVDRGVFRFDRNQFSPSSREFTPSWDFLSSTEDFIADAVYFGNFDAVSEQRLRAALREASQEKAPNELGASTTAFKMLSDSRVGAIKFSRGYRQLTELLRRELGAREAVRNIGLVLEVRTKGREQATISPLLRVTTICNKGPKIEILFAQRRRDCNDLGVCRVESVAEVPGNDNYELAYENLAKNGRNFLDQCNLETIMLVDGAEISRLLPGKFTSHTALTAQ